MFAPLGGPACFTFPCGMYTILVGICCNKVGVKSNKIMRWIIDDFSSLLFEPLLLAGYTNFSQLSQFSFLRDLIVFLLNSI